MHWGRGRHTCGRVEMKHKQNQPITCWITLTTISSSTLENQFGRGRPTGGGVDTLGGGVDTLGGGVDALGEG